MPINFIPLLLIGVKKILKLKKAALRKSLILLIIILVVLSLTVVSADKSLEKSKRDDLKVKDKDFNKMDGGVKEGKSIWHYKEGFLLQNITPETSKKGEYVAVEYENDSVIGFLNLSFRFYNRQAKVDFFEVFRNVSVQKIAFNHSDEQFFNATNASFYNITTINVSQQPSSELKWVRVAPIILNNGSTTYYTISVSSGEKVRATPMPLVYGAPIKYDVITAYSTNSNVIDPVLNATFFNATSQSDTNTSVPDFAPFVDGKWLMGAGNRSNITGYDSWGDLNYNANPDWKTYMLQTGGTCPFGANVTSDSFRLGTDDVGPNLTCTMEAIRNVNVSVPKEAGIIISWWQNKSVVDLNFEAGMCFVYDSSITNLTATRCNGGDEMFFITSDNTDNFLYGKGGVPNQGFGTSGQATQHFQVWFNESHVKSCVSGVCSALGAFATTNKVQSGYVVLMVYNNMGTVPQEANFFNLTIANASQFGQPLNYTPARFETVLINGTVVVDKVRITNTTYNYAGANANFFVMDANHLNQQSVNEGADTDITDFTGLIVNATFTPQNINTTSELYAVQVAMTVVVDSTAPIISNGTVSPSSVTVSEGTAVINVNATDVSANINRVIVEIENSNGKTNLSNSALVAGTNSANNVTTWQRNYTPTITGTHYVKFYAEDGNLNLALTADRNLSFESNAASGVGSSSNGGGSSQTVTVTEQNANATAIIDFGRPSLTLTVIAAPKQGRESYVIQNVGNRRFKGDILLSTTLAPYLSAQVCSLISGDCAVQDASISAGEKALLVIDYAIPREIGNGAEGLLRLEEESSGDVFELPVKIARPPGYGWYVQVANRYLNGDEEKAAVFFVLGSTAVLVLIIFISSKGL